MKLTTIAYGNETQLILWDRSTNACPQRKLWVIKKINDEADPANKKIMEARLRHEIEILRTLKHDNIVRFYTSFGNSSQLVMEYCDSSLTQLLQNLKGREEKRLEPTIILRFCCDILKALDYLHTKAFILHGDLKSYNVLVTGDCKIFKLCDFGVSVRTDENGIYNQANRPKYFGTPLWSAPEVHGKNGVISTKADIFSFGLIVYETLTLAPPHSLDNSNLEEAATQILGEFSITLKNPTLGTNYKTARPTPLLLGKRPALPATVSSDLAPVHRLVIEIFFACTNSNPNSRPSAAETLEYINSCYC